VCHSGETRSGSQAGKLKCIHRQVKKARKATRDIRGAQQRGNMRYQCTVGGAIRGRWAAGRKGGGVPSALGGKEGVGPSGDQRRPAQSMAV